MFSILGNNGRRWLRPAVFVLSIMMLVVLNSPASAAVWTDKEDYQPGEVVTISGDNSDGAGYLPGETVVVEVSGPNSYTASCTAVADEQGAWSCQVTLVDDETASGEYTYIAEGQSSNVIQSEEFFDSAGHHHFCWLKTGGAVWCAGSNEYGELGIDPGLLNNSDLPLLVDSLGNNVVQISGGYGYNCALRADGSVWCWGFNEYGQLGNGQQSDSYIPVFVSALGYDVAQINAGYYHACALRMDGSLWCWGRNDYGQLGIGSQANSYVPMFVSSLGYDVAKISIGNGHTCALKMDSSLWCWGHNNYGQLGTGSYNDSDVPVFVSALGSDVSQIDAGAFEHTCARKVDGSAWCWGRNHVGQLGNGLYTSQYGQGVHTPEAVISVGNQVARVLVTGTHSCALMTSGGVLCWGYNFDGQLGRGYYHPSYYPWPPGEPVPDYVGIDESKLDSGVTQISGGTCVLLVDGSVQCWGHNGYNNFGLGAEAGWRITLPTFVSALGYDVIALPDYILNPPKADPNGPYLNPLGSETLFNGSGSSDLEGDPLIYDWDWGDGTMSMNSGATPTHTYSDTEVYDVCLTVTDSDGLTDTACTISVIYNADGGFVTGGGWIMSPEGAYTPDPTLTGKATFGFVSKYKKRQSELTGNTEFQFKAGDLNFHSDSYDWLVVAGPKAMYKGVGTINGLGNYGFMLSAVDEALTPSTKVDRFRIKIWDMANGDAVVYDNQMGEDENADPTTAIGGGSIVIHKK